MARTLARDAIKASRHLSAGLRLVVVSIGAVFMVALVTIGAVAGGRW